MALPTTRPNIFNHTPGSPACLPRTRGRLYVINGMSVAENIRKKVGMLPHKPGIYLMRDRFGTVIYVGKARDLRKRVSQYFQASRRMGWDLKFNALVGAIHDLDFHVVRSEPEALLLESKLIKEFHPRYNVSFRDDKRFLMLKVNLNDPIPRFTLTRLKQEDGARYFGPFPSSSALRSTLALVRHQYHLRGCRPLTPNERDYKHCLYAHLKYCTAPCIAQRDPRAISGPGQGRLRLSRRPMSGNAGAPGPGNGQSLGRPGVREGGGLARLAG